MIQKQTFDDMPTTIFTVRTRLKQMRTLLDIWTAMTAMECERRLQGIRLKITIQTEKTGMAVEFVVNSIYFN